MRLLAPLLSILLLGCSSVGTQHSSVAPPPVTKPTPPPAPPPPPPPPPNPVLTTPTITVSANPPKTVPGTGELELIAALSSGTGVVYFTLSDGNSSWYGAGQIANGSAMVDVFPPFSRPGIYTVTAQYNGDAHDNPITGTAQWIVTGTMRVPVTATDSKGFTQTQYVEVTIQ